MKDTGVRDENGFEPIPSFSSPAKTLLQPNGFSHDATNSAEDSMDIDQSEQLFTSEKRTVWEKMLISILLPGTIPEPADLMPSLRKGRISLPPKATSPIKTHLNSSPRRSTARSVGPLSSPSRNSNNGTPTRASSHPLASKPPNRVLNFSPEETTVHEESPSRNLASSELNKAKVNTSSGRKKNRNKGKRVFDLTGRGDDIEDSEADATDGPTLTNGITNDENSIIPIIDDEPMVDSALDQEVPEADEVEEQSQESDVDHGGSMAPPPSLGAEATRKKRRRTAKSGTSNQEESQVSISMTEQPRRGRPPKKTQVYHDPDANLPSASSPAPGGKRHLPPSLRDPNARNKVKKTTHSKPPSRAGSVAAGPRFVQRSETPANDSGALITRFGRQSIKPLATWRGEKTVMGDRTFDTLPGIKEVIRVDEVVEPRPKQRYRKGRNRPRSRLADVEEEEIEEKASWELDPGIMVAQVMDWDADANKYDEESTREEGMTTQSFSKASSFHSLTLADIAYSYEAIQMRDIQGADFKFAKTLTLDFFGSGMVQLPPGGAKRIKNSRKMQMVFFVFYGRVTVNIGTPPTKFSIGKGGQWQVPRGKGFRSF